MKKIKILFILALLFMPYINVNADEDPPIGIDSYAVEVTTGSKVVYVIKGQMYGEDNKSNFAGKITYDTNLLEYVNIVCIDPKHIEGETISPDIKIVKNVKGELSYKVENPYDLSGRYDALVTFKVKSVPSEGKLFINFYPDTKGVLYGGEYIKIGANVLGNQTTEKDEDVVVYPEDDNEPIEEENEPIDENSDSEEESKEQISSDDNIEKEEKKEDLKNNCETNDVILYSLIASGLVNILLIVLLVIIVLKNKKTKSDNNEN